MLSNSLVKIDTNFDFRNDTPIGGDPDALSKTLRSYHQYLWSKSLPSGKVFNLNTDNGKYLCHNSELGEFALSSDSVVPSYIKWQRMAPIISQLREESEKFRSIGYTIGGMMIWPSVPKNGQKTINVARGFNQIIADRMDLTLECIRRYYIGLDSPLFTTLDAYKSFFDLFIDFKGFVDFFLLQDLVSEDYTSIKFFLPFDDFNSTGWPKDIDSYVEYSRNSISWVKARNSRIGLAYS